MMLVYASRRGVNISPRVTLSRSVRQHEGKGRGGAKLLVEGRVEGEVRGTERCNYNVIMRARR